MLVMKGKWNNHLEFMSLGMELYSILQSFKKYRKYLCTFDNLQNNTITLHNVQIKKKLHDISDTEAACHLFIGFFALL